MAAPSGALPVGRYLGALACIFAVLYALVFFTGDPAARPQLGLDLAAAPRSPCRRKTTDGKPPGSEELDQARQIIEHRVNGLGVAEAEVVTEGDRTSSSRCPARTATRPAVGATAQLRFRPVLDARPRAATPPAPPARRRTSAGERRRPRRPPRGRRSAAPPAVRRGDPDATRRRRGAAAPTAPAATGSRRAAGDPAGRRRPKQ